MDALLNILEALHLYRGYISNRLNKAGDGWTQEQGHLDALLLFPAYRGLGPVDNMLESTQLAGRRMLFLFRLHLKTAKHNHDVSSFCGGAVKMRHIFMDGKLTAFCCVKCRTSCTVGIEFYSLRGNLGGYESSSALRYCTVVSASLAWRGIRGWLDPLTPGFAKRQSYYILSATIVTVRRKLIPTDDA